MYKAQKVCETKVFKGKKIIFWFDSAFKWKQLLTIGAKTTWQESPRNLRWVEKQVAVRSSSQWLPSSQTGRQAGAINSTTWCLLWLRVVTLTSDNLTTTLRLLLSKGSSVWRLVGQLPHPLVKRVREKSGTLKDKWPTQEHFLSVKKKKRYKRVRRVIGICSGSSRGCFWPQVVVTESWETPKTIVDTWWNWFLYFLQPVSVNNVLYLTNINLE